MLMFMKNKRESKMIMMIISYTAAIVQSKS